MFIPHAYDNILHVYVLLLFSDSLHVERRLSLNTTLESDSRNTNVALTHELSIASTAADQRAVFFFLPWTGNGLWITVDCSQHFLYPSGKHSAEWLIHTAHRGSLTFSSAAPGSRSVPCPDLQTTKLFIPALSLIFALHVRTPAKLHCWFITVLFQQHSEFLCNHLPPVSICLAFSSDAPPAARLARLLPIVTELRSSHPAELQLIYSHRVKQHFMRDKQGCRRLEQQINTSPVENVHSRCGQRKDLSGFKSRNLNKECWMAACLFLSVGNVHRLVLRTDERNTQTEKGGVCKVLLCVCSYRQQLHLDELL